MRTWPLLLIPALALASMAQDGRSGTGTVTGHVYYVDTNAPARMASVQLKAVKAGSAGHALSNNAPPTGGVVETALDGSFVIPNVPPGSYYVIVTAVGYLTPHPDEDTDDAEPQQQKDRPSVAIPEIDVATDQTANLDIRLERGAAVSGNVRFDDGSPATKVLVMLQRRSKDKWVELPAGDYGAFAMPSSLMTDDLGHYRVAGLPAGEYIVAITLVHTDMLPAGHGAMSGTLRSVLFVYSGDTMRKSEAAPFKLGPGEDRAGIDITIPLSKLHSIGGVVTAASDGHIVNSGHLTIEDPTDKESVAEAELDSAGEFHLDGVPEGSYILRVINPSDKISEEISAAGMKMDRDRTIHQYGDLEQPIKVDGDIPNLVLSVPEQKKQTAAGSQ